MGKLVNRHPAPLEFLATCAGCCDEQDRRATSATHHPEDHGRVSAGHGNDEEVHTVPREPVGDRRRRLHGTTDPTANVLIGRPRSEAGHIDSRPRSRESLPIELPERPERAAEECAPVRGVHSIGARPGERRAASIGDHKTNGSVEFCWERLGAPQPLCLRHDHGVRVARSKHRGPETRCVVDTRWRRRGSQRDPPLGGFERLAIEPCSTRLMPLPDWDKRARRHAFEADPHLGAGPAVKDCNRVVRCSTSRPPGSPGRGGVGAAEEADQSSYIA